MQSREIKENWKRLQKNLQPFTTKKPCTFSNKRHRFFESKRSNFYDLLTVLKKAWVYVFSHFPFLFSFFLDKSKQICFIKIKKKYD